MERIKALLRVLDRWQRRNPVAGPVYGVVKKFGDDQANFLVVTLGWYGFTAIYPLMLVIVTALGYVGVSSLGSDLVNTLHKFPVIGQQFTPGRGDQLHGSVLALVIGLVGLAYGAQGVTQVAETAMAQVWNVPRFERPGFLPRLGRSFIGLAIIGVSFVFNAAIAGYATSSGRSYAIRVPVLAALLVVNVAFYFAEFRTLTPRSVATRPLVPGAVLGGVGFTLLITVGTGLVEHQLRNDSETYGAFASVIGVVVFLLLLSKLSIYAAELNPVLERDLYPRSILDPTTTADRRVYRALAHAQRNKEDMKVGVGFEPDPEQDAEADLQRTD